MQNLDELYELILDRKTTRSRVHNTEYLFNKGLDKF